LRRLVAGALLLVACGDPLVEQGYRGAPLYTFTGQIGSVSGGSTFEAPVRAAVFWSIDGTTNLHGDLVEQSAIALAVRFPGTFEINVFEPPRDVPWKDPQAPVRVGLVLVYEDVNGNHRLDPGELRGGARNEALLYVERAVPAAASPTGRALAPGFQAQRLPMPCGVPSATAGGDCGVPLGASCDTDADCGTGGLCLHRDEYSDWPGGYCLQRLSAGGCRPAGGVLLHTEIEGSENSYWHRRCETGADCRFAEGYVCEDWACLPDGPVALILDRSLEVAALCSSPGDDADHHPDGDDDNAH
jgi:hypothetical protein